jgi:hypothetical protein
MLAIAGADDRAQRAAGRLLTSRVLPNERGTGRCATVADDN